MPLYYAVIARQNVVLARHALNVGNFAEVTEKILTRIDNAKNKKMTFNSADGYMYHYISNDFNLTFLCIADESFKRTSAFAFLESISNKFETQFGSRSSTTAIPLAMNSEFSPILAAEMKKFNLVEDQNKLMPTGEGEAGPSSDDKIIRARQELDQVKGIMERNVDSLLERGERLDLLVDKTDHLSQNAVQFKQASTTLRRRMWWENKKMILIIVLVVIVIFYVVMSSACGGLDWPKCV